MPQWTQALESRVQASCSIHTITWDWDWNSPMTLEIFIKEHNIQFPMMVTLLMTSDPCLFYPLPASATVPFMPPQDKEGKEEDGGDGRGQRNRGRSHCLVSYLSEVGIIMYIYTNRVWGHQDRSKQDIWLWNHQPPLPGYSVSTWSSAPNSRTKPANKRCPMQTTRTLHRADHNYDTHFTAWQKETMSKCPPKRQQNHISYLSFAGSQARQNLKVKGKKRH